MNVALLLRRVGIAIGSFVAAWLAVWLVSSVSGIGTPGTGLTAVVTFLLGGLIYLSILRTERRTP